MDVLLKEYYKYYQWALKVKEYIPPAGRITETE